MHPREIARRTGEANARINAAVSTISEQLGLDAPDFGPIHPRGGQEVVRLKERERQAEYMEMVADRLAAGKAKGRGTAQGDKAQGAPSEEPPATPAASGSEPPGGEEPQSQEAENAPVAADGGLPPPVVTS